MKKEYLLSFVLGLFTTSLIAQNLTNKIKNRAEQEVNKLANRTTSNTSTGSSKNILSANVTRSVVVTLGADEIFDYQENCIELGTSVDQVSFIVTKQIGNSTQCYTYKNGTRSPIACPNGSNANCSTSLQCSFSALKELNSSDLSKYVSNEMESHTLQQPTISDEQLKSMAAFMTPAQLDEMKKGLAEAQKQAANQTYSTVKSSTITFNNKKYGPYKQLGKFFLTADEKNFYAIVGDPKDSNSPQVQNKLISSASTKIMTLSDYDSPISCFASPDNTDFGYVAMGMEGQKYVISTASGKNYDLPLNDGFGGAWFSATDNHVIYFSQSQLYRDGQIIKSLTDGYFPDACNIFVSSNGQGATFIKDNKISFADGDYFEYPLKISIITSNGKSYYKWLALENKEVVVYQKPY